jgi:F420-non-reducing hydrogenase small subunit
MAEKKLKLAFYWAASCGGCEIAVLDIDEKILNVVDIADIVFRPVAMDVKYKEVEGMPEKSIDVCFFNGGVRSEENEHMAKLLRQKAKVLVAFGSCAHQGGVPGLANLTDRDEIFEKVYLKNPSTINSNNSVPQTSVKVKEGELTLPKFYNTVKTLDQVVDVDYYLPGCPPSAKEVVGALEAIAKGKLPPKGSVIGPERSVCNECPRKREAKKISRIYRVYEIVPEPEKCLLDQGIICYGPATRGGCEAQCLHADMPCTGCHGPCPNAIEQGAEMINALASVMGLEDEKEKSFDPTKLMDQIIDPIGTFYKYSLASSILHRRIKK